MQDSSLSPKSAWLKQKRDAALRRGFSWSALTAAGATRLPSRPHRARSDPPSRHASYSRGPSRSKTKKRGLRKREAGGTHTPKDEAWTHMEAPTWMDDPNDPNFDLEEKIHQAARNGTVAHALRLLRAARPWQQRNLANCTEPGAADGWCLVHWMAYHGAPNDHLVQLRALGADFYTQTSQEDGERLPWGVAEASGHRSCAARLRAIAEVHDLANIPQRFVDPIALTLLRDPVQTSRPVDSGLFVLVHQVAYERHSIERWFAELRRQSDTLTNMPFEARDPLTNMRLKSAELTPMSDLLQEIEAFRNTHPQLFPDKGNEEEVLQAADEDVLPDGDENEPSITATDSSSSLVHTDEETVLSEGEALRRGLRIEERERQRAPRSWTERRWAMELEEVRQWLHARRQFVDETSAPPERAPGDEESSEADEPSPTHTSSR